MSLFLACLIWEQKDSENIYMLQGIVLFIQNLLEARKNHFFFFTHTLDVLKSISLINFNKTIILVVKFLTINIIANIVAAALLAGVIFGQAFLEMETAFF